VDLEGGIVANPYAQAPAPRTRPTTVTVSSYLLYVIAAVQLITAVIGLSQVGTMSRVLRDAYQGTAAAGAETVVVAIAVVSAVISILFAAGLTILAIFNNRGKQGSRITTWVVAGLALCCNGFGLLGNATTSSMNFDSGGTNGGPSSSQVERQLNAALPGWYTGTTVTLSLIALLALLAVIILLALPASNAYFRAAPAGWDPSQAYGGYPPGYGGQPPYPAPYEGQPSYPPYPTAPPAGPPPAGSPPAWAPPAGPPPGAQQPPGQPPIDPWSAPPPPPSSPPSPPSAGEQRPPSDPASGA
jgi:hypothetical protein